MQVRSTDDVCAAIRGARRIHVSDVLALRHALMGKARPSLEDATNIAALAAENFPACAQWREFVVDTISAFVIDKSAPRGELTEKNADWLIHWCESGFADALAFELAADAVQRAVNCPSALMRYLLGRLNDLSARVQTGFARDEEKAALEAARRALRAAGLAGRLYVPRDPPAPVADAERAAA